MTLNNPDCMYCELCKGSAKIGDMFMDIQCKHGSGIVWATGIYDCPHCIPTDDNKYGGKLLCNDCIYMSTPEYELTHDGYTFLAWLTCDKRNNMPRTQRFICEYYIPCDAIIGGEP